MEIPLPDPDGKYRMQVVEVPAPKDWETLSSDFVEFSFAIDASTEVPVEANGNFKTVGRKPKFRFAKRGDVYIPTGDLSTVEAATAYYHLSKMYKLVQSLNLEIAQFWPRRVYFAREIGSDNAFFAFYGDAIVSLAYSHEGVTPFANAEVFSHEFFHALSNHLWAQQWTQNRDSNAIVTMMKKIRSLRMNSSDPESLVLPITAVSAFGEGMADVFSFLVTGQSSVVANFINYRAEDRKLRGIIPYFLNFDPEDYDPDEHQYKLGTYYANGFLAIELKARNLEMTDIPNLSEEDRLSLIKTLIEFIEGPVFREVFEKRDMSVATGIAILNKHAEARLGEVDVQMFKMPTGSLGYSEWSAHATDKAGINSEGGKHAHR